MKMFENPNSWNLDFIEEAYALYDDNSDKLLNNLCSDCQQYECEHQLYQPQTPNGLQQVQSEYPPESHANANQLYTQLPPKQQLQDTFAKFGSHSTWGGAGGRGYGNVECVSESPQLQRHYPYRGEEQSYGVTLYPPRNYPALEAVPGITYPIEQAHSQNVPTQQQQLPMLQYQQQQLHQQQQGFQHPQQLQQPQWYIRNQHQPNPQLQLAQQYQPAHFAQQTYHEQQMNNAYPKWLNGQPIAHPAYPAHDYNYNGGACLPPAQESSAGCCQHHQTGAPGVNVQRILGHPPCRGNTPWSYSYCYGDEQNNYEPCHFIQCVDIEDFLNNEKRKEKSRDAARCRRSRETEIFSELAQILPLQKEDVSQLDKASIMRIAIAFLRVRKMLQLFPKIKNLIGDLELDKDIEDNSNSSTASSMKPTNEKIDLLKCAESVEIIKQTLDGFLIILSNDGDITYVSENVTDYLGLAKIDILGQQIWEYSHQCDHAELKEALNIKRKSLTDTIKDENMIEEGLSTDHRDLFVRFKCTLTSRGRSINIKSASYKVIHITGHLVVNMNGDRVLIAIGRPIPHPSNIEIPLGSTTFLTKHSLDMKFTYVDEKMQNLFGYKAQDLVDHSLFACHHGADSDKLMSTFKTGWSDLMQVKPNHLTLRCIAPEEAKKLSETLRRKVK